MRGIGEMVGFLGGWHLHPLSVPCVFGCSSEVNACVVRRCCPRYEFFSDLVERGSEMPDFDGHDLFCHFKQSERCHGNLAVSCQGIALRHPTNTTCVFRGTCTYVATCSRERACCRLWDHNDPSFDLGQRQGSWYDGS